MTTTEYLMMGTTDELTECERCGRVDLKATYMLAPLDADGNAGDIVYYGSSCAARALGRKLAAIKTAAAATDTLMASARRWADEFRPLSFDTYADANRATAERFGRNLMNDYLSVQREVRAIDAGTLIGTRFEREMVKV